MPLFVWAPWHTSTLGPVEKIFDGRDLLTNDSKPSRHCPLQCPQFFSGHCVLLLSATRHVQAMRPHHLDQLAKAIASQHQLPTRQHG